jgi:hypothetical protein
MKLNKELMTRWIKALESGKYRQGREMLKQHDDSGHVRYCCLGVLQRIEPRLEVGEGEDEELLNPTPVRKILGCNLDQEFLSRMNDGHEGEPWNFKQIAQHLRKKYKITA